ncbi:hypothetical protein F989_02782 [Acinetobacter parvus NIPH 1103]|jgi:transposase-like protein|uniref:Transposase Synechocystis PCC 6803 domain-containing protein n=1 Tax=Acinetobacter parvus NIPH 1103 TaxID=1217671 RepID=N8Q0H5_9GAMM|nr:hypothetical protein F989_02782 [Acinetobacter parvus NIPH 1103]
MSYSEHFRRKILAKLEEGYSIRAVAAQFEINRPLAKVVIASSSGLPVQRLS